MAHVTFTRHLRRFFPALEDGEVPGATVRELVGELDRRHRGLASYLVDERGRLRRHVNVFIGDEHRVFERVDPYLPKGDEADAHGGLRAPMPGRILVVNVQAGDAVARGAPLVVMEAMKMEHTITAPAAGVVQKVMCAVGEQVKEGTELLVVGR